MDFVEFETHYDMKIKDVLSSLIHKQAEDRKRMLGADIAMERLAKKVAVVEQMFCVGDADEETAAQAIDGA